MNCGITLKNFAWVVGSIGMVHGGIRKERLVNNCQHQHTKPAGFPMGALICTGCARLLDINKQPLQAAVTERMKPDHKQAEEDKKDWD